MLRTIAVILAVCPPSIDNRPPAPQVPATVTTIQIDPECSEPDENGKYWCRTIETSTRPSAPQASGTINTNVDRPSAPQIC
jgi:hypothetical protein